MNVTGDVFAADLVLAVGDTTTFPKRPHLVGALDGSLTVEGGDSGADRSLLAALAVAGRGRPRPPGDHAGAARVRADRRAQRLRRQRDHGRHVHAARRQAHAVRGTGRHHVGLVPHRRRHPQHTHAVNTNVEVVEPAARRRRRPGHDQRHGPGRPRLRHQRRSPTTAASPSCTAAAATTPSPSCAAAAPAHRSSSYGDTTQDGAWYAGNPAAVAFGLFGAKPFPNQLGNTPHVPVPARVAVRERGRRHHRRPRFGGVLGITAYGGARQRHDRRQPGGRLPRRRLRRRQDPGRRRHRPALRRLRRQRRHPHPCAHDPDRERGRPRRTPTCWSPAATRCSARARPPPTEPARAFADVIFGDHGAVIQDTLEAVVGPTATTGRPRSSRRSRPRSSIIEITTREPGNGAADVIDGDAGRDRMLAGNGADTVNGNDGDDIVLGDNGRITYAAPDSTGGSPLLITTTDPTVGAADVINGNGGNDMLFGGTAGDTIAGDDGNDLIFGDHGRVDGVIDSTLLPLSSAIKPFAWTSIDTGADVGRRRRPPARQRGRRHRHRRPGRRPHHRRRRRRRPDRRPQRRGRRRQRRPDRRRRRQRLGRGRQRRHPAHRQPPEPAVPDADRRRDLRRQRAAAGRRHAATRPEPRQRGAHGHALRPQRDSGARHLRRRQHRRRRRRRRALRPARRTTGSRATAR